jgi:hypothetical protein
MKKIFFLLASLVVCASHSQAAVTAPDSAFATFYSRVTGPGVQTVGFGSNGTPVVAPGVPSVSSAGGPVQVARTGSLPLPAGARLPVTATAKIPNSAVASIIKKALPYARTATNPLALTLLAIELGFALTTSDTAEPVISQTVIDPALCYSGPCYKWPVQSGGYTENKQTAARSWCDYYQYPNTNCTFTVQPSGWQIAFFVTATGYGTQTTTRNGVTGGTVVAPSATPATAQQFADAIAAKSGWPSGSTVAQAVVDASRVTGEAIPTDQPTVTGPATVAGPTEVVSTPYGDQVRKSTKASSYSCTYVQGATVMDGGSAICVQKTTTTNEVTTTDPVTGVATTTTTTGEQATKPADIKPDEKPDKDTCGMPGTPACKIDERGTPSESPITEAKIVEGTNAVKSAQDALRERVVGDSDKRWAWTLLGAPPMAECEPVQFPAVFGVTPPPMDPCGSVPGIRAVMAWIWALVGFGLCISLVREVI